MKTMRPCTFCHSLFLSMYASFTFPFLRFVNVLKISLTDTSSRKKLQVSLAILLHCQCFAASHCMSPGAMQHSLLAFLLVNEIIRLSFNLAFPVGFWPCTAMPFTCSSMRIDEYAKTSLHHLLYCLNFFHISVDGESN